MDMKEIREQAKKRMKGCRVCPECNGKACVGMIPGFGGLRTGRSFARNLESLQEYGLIMRSMSGVEEPSTAVEIFGKTLSLPILIAPVGGIVLNAQVDGDPEEEEIKYDEAVTQALWKPAPGPLPATAARRTCTLRASRPVKSVRAASSRRLSRGKTTRSSKRPYWRNSRALRP